MRIGSLFSGIGGLDIALEQFGHHVAWTADNDKWASQVLAQRLPGVPNLGDLTEIQWGQVPGVDILTGGFPCQDISHAGKREGINGKRSGLWSEYVRAIRQLRPRWVFVENVAALRGRGLDIVLADLARLGFNAEWSTLRAGAIGAPHRRDRLFLLAQNTNVQPRVERRIAAPGETTSWWPWPEPEGRGRASAADADLSSDSRDRHPTAAARQPREGFANRSSLAPYPDHPAHNGQWAREEPRDGSEDAAEPSSERRSQGWAEPAREQRRLRIAGSGGESPTDAGGQRRRDNTGAAFRQEGEAGPGQEGDHIAIGIGEERLFPTPTVSRARNATAGRSEGSQHRPGTTLLDVSYADTFGDYAYAIKRWADLTREPPDPRLDGRLNPDFVEWMMGYPEGWTTTGAPKTQRLKMLGNAVVPQQAAYAWWSLGGPIDEG